MATYTTLFQHLGGGTHVAQVRAHSIDRVLEVWLEALGSERTTLLGRSPSMTILEYFDGLIENPRSFERQVRQALEPNVHGIAERLSPVGSMLGVWYAGFLIVHADVEHHARCPAPQQRGLSDPETFVEAQVTDPDCEACADDASFLCELWVVESSSP